MGHALPVTIQLTDMTCGECGINYAVPETWRAEKQRNAGSGSCPNGHGWQYRESEADRVRKQLSEALRTNTELAARAHRAEVAEEKTAKEMRRMRKRVHAGVCPCCNRTFQNLARHMKTKHPDRTTPPSSEGERT